MTGPVTAPATTGSVNANKGLPSRFLRRGICNFTICTRGQPAIRSAAAVGCATERRLSKQKHGRRRRRHSQERLPSATASWQVSSAHILGGRKGTAGSRCLQGCGKDPRGRRRTGGPCADAGRPAGLPAGSRPQRPPPAYDGREAAGRERRRPAPPVPCPAPRAWGRGRRPHSSGIKGSAEGG